MSSRAQSSRNRRGRNGQQQNTGSTRVIGIVVAVATIAVIALVATQLFGGGGGATVASGDLSGFASKGQANAPVTVVEYADFQCPGCAAFALTQGPQIDKDYVDTGKVRFVYHEFPLTSIHRNAIVAGEAGRCAADQGKFWPMHGLLFANQQRWGGLSSPQGEFGQYATAAGLNADTFNQCLSSGTHRATVQAAQAAAEKAQIQSTPTFLVNGKTYTAQNVRQGIDEALAAVGQ